MSSVSALSQALHQGTRPGATNAQKQEALKEAVREVTGQLFFGSLLKSSRESSLKSELGHGGRGEAMFRSQLDQELVRRMSHASQNNVAEAMYEKLAKRYVDRYERMEANSG